ncbi:MAG TPA: HAMP domain-containing protein, partial [Gemmatimonadaceae bacterium]
MTVGERPEVPEQEREGARPARPTGTARGKRGRPRRAAAASEIDVTERVTPRGGGVVPRGNGGGGGGRDRSLRRLLAGLRALDAGDFSIRLELADDPVIGELAEIFNNVATKQSRLSEELNRVALSVGREGKMRDRATIGPAGGSWAGSVDALNSLITDLVQPTSEVARVIKAVAEGDLSQKVELEIDGKTVQGEFF